MSVILNEVVKKSKPGLGRVVLAQCYSFVDIWLMSCLIIFAFLGSFFSAYSVKGRSMYPTLNDTQYVLADKISYGLKIPWSNAYVTDFDEPTRGDIVIIKTNKYRGNGFKKNVCYVKRCMGLPGEKVAIKGTQIYINDMELDEPYLRDCEDKLVKINNYQIYYSVETFYVPIGFYFVIGDNRYNTIYGLVAREEMIGKLIKY
jgi:signal peptidase I